MELGRLEPESVLTVTQSLPQPWAHLSQRPEALPWVLPPGALTMQVGTGKFQAGRDRGTRTAVQL